MAPLYFHRAQIAPLRQAHMAASELMISVVSELFAVWDGKPARGSVGTADVVARARGCGRRVRVIWPERATRD